MLKNVSSLFRFSRSALFFTLCNGRLAILSVIGLLITFSCSILGLRSRVALDNLMLNLDRKLATTKDILSCAKLSLLSTFLISMKYFLKPFYSYIAVLEIDMNYMKENLRIAFEAIDAMGPSKMLTFHARRTNLFLKSIIILIFSLPYSIFSIFSAGKMLFVLLGTRPFFLYIVVLFLFSAGYIILKHKLLIAELRQERLSWKKETELAEVCENIIAVHMSDQSIDSLLLQHSRDPLHVRCAFLRVASDIFRKAFFTLLETFLITNSRSVQESITTFLHSLSSINSSISDLLDDLINEIKNYTQIKDNYEMRGITHLVDYQEKRRPHLAPNMEKLSLVGVTLYRGQSTILQNINLSFKMHGLVALIGRNGSGKSTFMRFLLGLHSFDGQVVGSFPNRHQKDISRKMLLGLAAYSSQRPLFFDKTVIESIKEGGEYTDEEIAIEMQKCGLHEYIIGMKQGYMTEMGVGTSLADKQLISLGRCFIRDAPVILLDEPFEHLESKHTEQLTNYLVQEKKRKLIFVVTHCCDDMQVYDRVLMAKEGELLDVTNK